MTSSVPEHDQWAYHKRQPSEFVPNLAELGQIITQSVAISRLDRIAELILGLTYGHMIALSAELSSHGPITKDTLPGALWAWSISERCRGACKPNV